MLEIAQPAMNQLAGPAGRTGGDRLLFQHQHAMATSGGRLGNADAMDPRADDYYVVALAHVLANCGARSIAPMSLVSTRLAS